MAKQVLFSGHMIDAPNREFPRFPARDEQRVKMELKKVLTRYYSAGSLQGISSAAAGGDILFHEICYWMGIPTQIYLPSPPEEFRKDSVDFAGGDWGERFDRVLQNSPYFVLEVNQYMGEENVYTLTNNWMIEEARRFGEDNLLLIALWNGKKGDGGGGTWEMVKTCQDLGIAFEHISSYKRTIAEPTAPKYARALKSGISDRDNLFHSIHYDIRPSKDIEALGKNITDNDFILVEHNSYAESEYWLYRKNRYSLSVYKFNSKTLPLSVELHKY